jgi:serine/threonine-protein kinase RsbW
MKDARITDLMQRVMTDRTRPGQDSSATWAEFPGVAESVAACRRFIAGGLGDACPRADDLVLAVSELATNAVRWSASGEGGTFLVRVRRVTLWARVEVVDAGPASAPPGSGNGYGLLVVREATDRSGANFLPDGRRAAWAECTWSL